MKTPNPARPDDSMDDASPEPSLTDDLAEADDDEAEEFDDLEEEEEEEEEDETRA